jgi:NTP pyrophosphatase (non-canonical NTP hydrolase)
MIEPLRDIMARLRDPENGCPWDKVQDFRSIAPYTIEEAYEVADAISNYRSSITPAWRKRSARSRSAT